MPQEQRKSLVDARALLRRSADEFLIVKSRAQDDSIAWEFPGGALEGRESPEAALRRHCQTQLGVKLNLEIGQPPFTYDFGDRSVVYRYYFCSLAAGAARAQPSAEIRWVQKGQLREYVFDAPTQQVVDWLLESRTG